jgi:putative spermidine/putrescine transport system ATP-binding protein
LSFLSLQGLACRYGDITAVRDLDLDVHEGEFVCLLGPSGCGKTTTLQMIAGFVRPSAGRIVLAGQDLLAVPANRRGIGIVFQSYALFPHMSVAQNVSFGLEMRKVAAADRAARVARALAQVHLDHLAARYPRQLSGGQQQRVALARALVIEPRLLLLDEPMSNLDAKLREDMQLELRRLQRALGITTVMVTHDQTEAMALSDRIAVMRAGRVVQVDTPRRAYEQPADGFASSFLGKSNALPGRVEPGGVRLANGLLVPAATGTHAGGAHAGEVVCTVRPERVRMLAPGTGLVAGRVRARIFLGSHWLFQIETALGDMLVYCQNSGADVPDEGQAIDLAWTAEDMTVLAGEDA